MNSFQARRVAVRSLGITIRILAKFQGSASLMEQKRDRSPLCLQSIHACTDAFADDRAPTRAGTLLRGKTGVEAMNWWQSCAGAPAMVW
ncbi:hypothetical protein BS630_34340 [Rhizobium laguerreae]|nr:hypothetical protein BS630_34340 [Rhizobium laguerreae]